MFRKSYNRAVLQVHIETQAPLLIRAGDAGLDPVAADLSCVRTQHGMHGRTVYIPGSSLKGVIRSSIEARLRSLSLSKGRLGSCDPLEHKNACSTRRAATESSWEVHARNCLACRTFGSLTMQGHAAIRDLFPWTRSENMKLDHSLENFNFANRVEVRHNVSINRSSGAVQHGPFDMEVIPPGVHFYGELALQNYQAWQLGLLAMAQEEFNDGVALLGSTKSRGLGAVKLTFVSLMHEQVREAGVRVPKALGHLATPEECQDYDFVPETALPVATPEERGLSLRFLVRESAELQQWLDAGMRALEALHVSTAQGGAR